MIIFTKFFYKNTDRRLIIGSFYFTHILKDVSQISYHFALLYKSKLLLYLSAIDNCFIFYAKYFYCAIYCCLQRGIFF